MNYNQDDRKSAYKMWRGMTTWIAIFFFVFSFSGYSESDHLSEIADKYFGPRNSPCKLKSVTIKEIDSTIIKPELLYLVKDKTVIRISQDSVFLPLGKTESSDSLMGKLDIYYCEDEGGLLKIVYSIKEYKEVFLQRNPKLFETYMISTPSDYDYDLLDNNFNYNFQNILSLIASDLQGEVFELNGYLFLYSPKAGGNMFWVNEKTGPKATWDIGILKRSKATTGEKNVPITIRHHVDANTGELSSKMINQMITSPPKNPLFHLH